MVAALKEQLRTGKKKLLLSAFGVGLSWGSAIIETDKVIIPDLLEV